MTEPRRVVIVVFPGRPAARCDRAGGGVPHGRARSSRGYSVEVVAAETRPAAVHVRRPDRRPGVPWLPRADRHADRRGRSRVARRAPGRAHRLVGAGRRRPARAACARCAPAPSCSPRPGCSTAGARRPTGPAATASRERYPEVTVERDPIFVRDGNVYTSAGVTAGMDLALALVEEDLGRRTALEVARWLVLFVKRPGGQSQFSAQLAAQTADREPLRDLQDWIAGNLDADLSVPALAERAHMSERNFARAFRRELGLTPAAYVEVARVEAARMALEATGTPVEAVAAQAASAPSRRCGARSTAASAWARRVPRPLHVNPSRLEPERGAMDIAIPLYDRFTALDAIGPYEVLSRLPDARVAFVATEAGPYKTDNGMLTILAEASLDDLPQPEIVCVPGGWGTREAMSDERLVGLDPRRARDQPVDDLGLHRLAAAGRRRRARGPRGDEPLARARDARRAGCSADRAPGRRAGQGVTAAGVSSGIDMALVLLAKIAGDEFAKTIQLLIEYDPQPPFDAGSPRRRRRRWSRSSGSWPRPADRLGA